MMTRFLDRSIRAYYNRAVYSINGDNPYKSNRGILDIRMTVVIIMKIIPIP